MLRKALSLIIALGLLLSLAILPAQAQDYTPPLVGDVNSDSVVNIIDVTYLQRILAGMEVPFTLDKNAADADENGSVDVTDVTHLQRWMVDLEQNLNIGEPVYEWVDKSLMQETDNLSDIWMEDLVITRICRDHFFAVPYFPLPGEFRINGSISDHWCVGDHVYCTFNNVYQSDDYWLVEGDLLTIEVSTAVMDPNVCYKPVIYLYPEEKTEVNVQLDLDGEFLYTNPAYEDGWTVAAAPDGTLTDACGNTYPYLFWEGKLNADYDLSKGFCVKGEDTAAFLNEKLAVLGLNDKEIADFTEFWTEYMEKNPYNVISFQTDAYTDAAKLNVSPAPDSVIRVFMTWYASDEAVDVPAQELTAPERSGFTVVEWGGQMVK